MIKIQEPNQVIRIVLAASILVAMPDAVLAHWWHCIPCWPRLEHSHRRAGYGGRVAWWAIPSDTPAYVGYYVGGGAAVGGEPRCLDEGTWGWDYCGHLLPRRVILRWWHDRHYQGGGGQYQTDGPISPSSKSPKK